MIKYVKFVKLFGITWQNSKLAKKSDTDLSVIKARWSSQILDHLNVKVQVSGMVDHADEPMVLVGNHSSYLDIPLVVKGQPKGCFVSKSEVKSWPIIGPAAVNGETIFVKRESRHSRANVRGQILQALVENKKKVVIFPSGTTTLGPSNSWKKGAFDIANEGQIKMQMFRIRWTPDRALAYIDDDVLLKHVFNLFKLPEIKAHIEFGESFYIKDLKEDLARAKAWCEASF